MSRVRNFCFTLNSSDKDVMPEPIDCERDIPAKVEYCIQGFERGETGRCHIQGYIKFKDAKLLKTVINVLQRIHPGAHVEVTHGTPYQNFLYCSKDNDFIEYGKRPTGQGTRTDIITLAEMVREGMSDKEICETVIEDDDGEKKDYGEAFIKFHKGIREMRRVVHSVERDWEMDVRIYWGPTGTGKSRAAHEEFGESLYVKSVGKWWDGYDGENAILIDDFDPDHCHEIVFDQYLRLLDRYKMKLEVKGGFESMRSKVIIFTSNFDPRGWFIGRGNRAAFFRRVTHIEYFGHEGRTVESLPLRLNYV